MTYGAGAGQADGWCIVRTSGGRTLSLAQSLIEAGIEAWSPRRIIKRPAPGQRRALVMGRRRVMVEVAVPILPTFVFVRACHLDALAVAAAMPISPHPAFTLFSFAGRVPLVSELSVAGLRVAEQDAETAIQAERDAETKEAARRARAETLRSERARSKALRAERKTFEIGAEVTVTGVPALAGMSGRVVQSAGTAAVIDFGGTLTMRVEAWRVLPVALQGGAALAGAAA